MNLVRDLLDKPVVDRYENEIGRVDGIVLSIAKGEPPRVTAIEIGPAVLAHRFHPVLGRIAAILEDWFGVGKNRPSRIGIEHIADVGETVVVDVSAASAGLNNVERAVRKMIGAR